MHERVADYIRRLDNKIAVDQREAQFFAELMALLAEVRSIIPFEARIPTRPTMTFAMAIDSAINTLQSRREAELREIEEMKSLKSLLQQILLQLRQERLMS
jgi:hypothetical protein